MIIIFKLKVLKRTKIVLDTIENKTKKSYQQLLLLIGQKRKVPFFCWLCLGLVVLIDYLLPLF